MRAALLKRLSDAGDIAKIDVDPRPLTLAPTSTGWISWYGGVYAGCGIEIDADTLDPTLSFEGPVSVSARQFQQLMALFPDNDEVVLSVVKSELLIQSRTRKVSLRFEGNPDLTGYDKLKEIEPIVTANMKDVAPEIALAASTAADTVANPVLTGVRIIAAGKLLGVQSANAISTIFESAVAANASDRYEVIAPSSNIVAAVSVLKSETIGFGLHGKGIVLKGEHAVVKLPMLSGTWPKLDQMKNFIPTDELTLPISSIRSLAQAIRAYDASDEAVIRPCEGGVLMETREHERGKFEEILEGTIGRTFILKVEDLETAAKVAEDEVKLEFGDKMALLRAGNRKLYMLLRVA